MGHYRIVRVLRNGDVQQTDFSGYLGETVADQTFKKVREDKWTFSAFLFVIYDGTSEAPFADVRNSYQAAA